MTCYCFTAFLETFHEERIAHLHLDEKHTPSVSPTMHQLGLVPVLITQGSLQLSILSKRNSRLWILNPVSGSM